LLRYNQNVVNCPDLEEAFLCWGAGEGSLVPRALIRRCSLPPNALFVGRISVFFFLISLAPVAGSPLEKWTALGAFLSVREIFRTPLPRHESPRTFYLSYNNFFPRALSGDGIL